MLEPVASDLGKSGSRRWSIGSRRALEVRRCRGRGVKRWRSNRRWQPSEGQRFPIGKNSSCWLHGLLPLQRQRVGKHFIGGETAVEVLVERFQGGGGVLDFASGDFSIMIGVEGGQYGI